MSIESSHESMEREFSEEQHSEVEAPEQGAEATAGPTTEYGVEEPQIETPEQAIERLNAEVEELRGSWARERADHQNSIKRWRQEIARARTQGVVQFVHSLLPVLDNLERVLTVKSDNPELKNFLTGVEMIRSEFIEAFKREGVRSLTPLNEPFDPYCMEAIGMEEQEGIESDTVTEVYQSGFLFQVGESDPQVLRPARVKVARPVKQG